jgi:ParB-like chromosome segregation protein Spo0J
MAPPTNTDFKSDVDVRDLDAVIPYGENPKEHPTEQIDKIASSIQRFGWDQPIVVDGNGTIIKGHGRYQAAQKLGLTEVPVIEQSELTESQARAARIADNRVSESEYDDELLELELGLLDESNVSVEATGFDAPEIEELTGPPPEFDPVDESQQPQLDETDGDESDAEVCCPECGHEFEP